MSTPGWSRALADVLGAPLQALDAEGVRRWVRDGLRESEQLDFKAEHYGNGESQRRELAGDVAAFANHRGGLLILGVGEDEQGAASSLPLVPLTDDEQRRIHQILAGNVFPHLRVEIFAVALGDHGRGVMLIAVAPSPERPHAVLVNEALRYPRRNGSVTRYLSESEVADLYRDRFAIQRADVDRVSAIRREAIERLDQGGAVWIAVSTVPSGVGSMTISEQSITRMRAWAQRFTGDDEIGGFLGQAAPVVRPGLRRVRLMTHYVADSAPNYQYAELHTDGAAVALLRLTTDDDAPVDGSALPVTTTYLLWTTAKALNVAAAHALNVGAWGDVTVEVVLFGPPRLLATVHVPFNRLERIPGGAVLDSDLVSQHTLALTDLATGAQPLLAATRLLLTDVFNAFGASEVEAIRPNGALSAAYVAAHRGLDTWAAQSDVAIE